MPEMAVDRVAKRVREGGHNIPEETIYRRYQLGLQNFFTIFVHVVDSWMFIQNIDEPVLLATERMVLRLELYNQVKEICQKTKKKL